MDGRGARRRIAFAVAMSVVVVALLGFAAFEFTGRVNHAVAGRTTANHMTAGRAAASPAASEAAKATASARIATAPASPRSPSPRPASPRSPSPQPASPWSASPRPAQTSERATPSGTPSASPRVLLPVSATAFGPDGTADGDHPQDAPLVLTDPAQGWKTYWYATPQFGALKTGTGLLLDMGHPVTITAVLITLGAQPGANLELRAGPALAGLTTLTSAADAGGSVDLPLSQPAYARYVLLWFTRLPPDGVGTYQVTVHGITVHGEP